MATARPNRTPHLMTVADAWHITPNMIRVTLDAEFIRDLPEAIEGAHCKIYLPTTDEDPLAFHGRLQTGPRPTMRTYTIRHIRPWIGEIDIDFVDHGDAGPASAWARRAKPGAVCGFGGPGPVKLKTFHADSYVVAADMSALPVAAATLEAMPRDAKGVAFLEITSPEDIQDINAPTGVTIHWLAHPDPHTASTQVPELIKALPAFEGRVQTCIAGESSVIQALRAHLMHDRKLDKADAYISGYWKIGLVEDEHQEFKRSTAA